MVSTTKTRASRPTLPETYCEAPHQAFTRRMRECPYAFVFDKVEGDLQDGVLRLTGKVPSFYLKQVLQEWMRGAEGVRRIQNDVDVVSAQGLSSVRQMS